MMCVYVHKTKKQIHQGDDNTARTNSQRKKLLNLLNQILHISSVALVIPRVCDHSSSKKKFAYNEKYEVKKSMNPMCIYAHYCNSILRPSAMTPSSHI